MRLRPQQRVERKYVVEYILDRYPPGTLHSTDVPIGMPPDSLQHIVKAKGLDALRKWRKYADALVKLPNRLDLIEAKIHHPQTGIADLLEYMELIDETPEFKAYKHMPKRYILVVPYVRPHWERMAKRYGFIIDEFITELVLGVLQRRKLL